MDGKNVKLGTSTVEVNGTDIGYTSGGVSLTFTYNKRETVYDAFGTIVRNSIVTSITAAVSFVLLESQLENLKLIMTGSASSGSNLSGTEGQKTLRLNVTIKSPGVTYQFSDYEIDSIAVSAKPDSELAYTLSATATLVSGVTANIS